MHLSQFLRGERGRTMRTARRAGIAQGWLSQMASGLRPVPPELCWSIEQACDGAVRRWDLRAEDWHRIWPELVGSAGAPAVPVVAAIEAPESSDAA